MQTQLMTQRRSSFVAGACLLVPFCIACSDPGSDPVILTADLPLHLEDHLDVATIEGSEVPADLPEAVEWHFDEPQPDWQPVVPWSQVIEPVEIARTDDALQIVLTEANNNPRGNTFGGVYVDLPNWRREDWGYVVVRARSTGVQGFQLRFNYVSPHERPGFASPPRARPFHFLGDQVGVIADGSVQTYLLTLDVSSGDWAGPWRQLGLIVNSSRPASIDILEVSVVPKEATFADAPVGVRTEVKGEMYRRTLYTHAPGRLAYRVRIPDAGQLDVGLGVVRRDVPVTFQITAAPRGGQPETLLEETYADASHWAQRRVDLSHLAGQDVTLALTAEAERAGTVALWAAPTLSGTRTTDKPNVIFYIIDGASADYMSVYGYNRRTTPNLERIAAEGAVFERAYSNSSWTRPSTASFLTSMHHSVLGGLNRGRNPVPEQVLTLAEHLRRAGYYTGMFTTNPNAGRMSNLDRGHDVFREAGVTPTSASSVELHENFWQWREAYPGEPYWVHFQTTDVHFPHTPLAPFAGLFISPERREIFEAWDRRLRAAGGGLPAFEETGISRVGFFTAARDLHDETMAHQDYQLGQLVARLKASGQWERTLLIVAADHGIRAGSQDYGLVMRDPFPSGGFLSHVDPRTPIFRSGTARIPLIVVWPERIVPGQRFSDPVSMIDMLPTILDLADLPMPEVMQGQSLAPLLLGEAGWEPQPVILDQFEVDNDTGEFRGRIEVVDGRWGASLEINPDPELPTDERRPVPLLVYDLWNDPMCLHSVHEERPDLVEKYTAFLEARWEAHQALAQQFTPGEESPLTPEQLRTLRSLGYIR